ncbi:hypothetical protein BFF94_017285 [Burkholderia catarinensis]|nr:hypothetical protein BFF94_017285 [Burkholderia catarinensis]
MELCSACVSLQGHPADRSNDSGMTLIGIGACDGTVAIEHYRCQRCGVVMHRQFVGSPAERIWTVLYRTA